MTVIDIITPQPKIIEVIPNASLRKWGSIIGNIQDQDDLLQLIDDKAPPSISFGTIYRSGRFFSIPFTNVNSGIGFLANNIKVYPFIVPIDVTLASIRIKISSGRPNAKACLGIYADNGNFYPGEILVNAGEVDCSTSGTKTISFSENLTKDMKLVWLAVNINDGGVGYLYITGGLNILGNSAPNCMYNAPYNYASTLPTTFPADATENQGPIDGILVEVGIA